MTAKVILFSLKWVVCNLLVKLIILKVYAVIEDNWLDVINVSKSFYIEEIAMPTVQVLL